MGGAFSSLLAIFQKNENLDFKLLMIGLDSAGKTTIVYKLKSPDSQSTHPPTIGYNLEEIEVKNVKIKVWDLAGQEKMRGVWKHYIETVNGIIFVLDSSDRERITEAREELHQILGAVVGEVPVLVLANKQDVPGAMPYAELKDNLGMSSDFEKRGGIRIQETSAIQEKGLKEGFEWIVDEVVKRSKQ